jgi:hypothetical protein
VETGPALLGPIGGGSKVEYGTVGVVSAIVLIDPFAKTQSLSVGSLFRIRRYGRGMPRLYGTQIFWSLRRWVSYLDVAYPTKPADYDLCIAALRAKLTRALLRGAQRRAEQVVMHGVQRSHHRTGENRIARHLAGSHLCTQWRQVAHPSLHPAGEFRPAGAADLTAQHQAARVEHHTDVVRTERDVACQLIQEPASVLSLS